MDENKTHLGSLQANEQPRTFNTGYSKTVRRLRLILPMIAVAIVAALFTWVSFDDEGAIIENPPLEETKKTAQNELLNPNFESTDNQGRPYSVTALKASQDDNDENLVRLEKPQGTIKLQQNETLTLQAEQGRYHQEQKTLHLTGAVNLLYNQNYEITSSAVQVDLNNSIAWSQNDTQGGGPLGTVKAKGFEIDVGSEKLILQGPATLTLNSEAL